MTLIRLAAYAALTGLLLLVITSCKSVYVGALRPEVPCYGNKLGSCLPAQDDLRNIAIEHCEGRDRRVCVVPLGSVDADLVRGLVAHFRQRYGLPVAVLTPQPVPASLVSNNAQQIDSEDLIAQMRAAFPDEAEDSMVTLIGLTPLDLYSKESTYHFVFGSRGSALDPKAVISTFRMDPRTFREGNDEELRLERAEKMMERYVGLLHYQLNLRPDPSSPLANEILGLTDLDYISDELPVARPGP